MEASRRSVLAAGSVFTAMLASGTHAAPGEISSGRENAPACKAGTLEVIHVYAGADGVSHFRKVPVAFGTMKDLPVARVVAACMAPGIEDWHVAPTKTFTINMAGDIIGEFGDGTSVPIGKGDLVYLEDTAGTGHVTRLLSDVANLFLQMPDDFDFLAWAGAADATAGA